VAPSRSPRRRGDDPRVRHVQFVQGEQGSLPDQGEGPTETWLPPGRLAEGGTTLA
jgi:hypothetical protein